MAEHKPKPESRGLSLAGAAIATALIDALVAKGIFTKDEALAVMKDAQLQLAPYIQTTDGFDAAQIVIRTIQRINKDGRK